MKTQCCLSQANKNFFICSEYRIKMERTIFDKIGNTIHAEQRSASGRIAKEERGQQASREQEAKKEKLVIYNTTGPLSLARPARVFPGVQNSKGAAKTERKNDPLRPAHQKKEKKRRTSRTTTLEKKKKADEEKTREKRRARACPYFSRRGSALFCKNNVIRLPISSE